MTKLFCVGILVAATLFAVPAVASVPFPGNCTVQWFQPVASGLILVCPKGDYSALDVTVRDQFNLPVAGQTVTATFASADLCPQPISGITDALGYVRLTIKSGTNAQVATSPRVNSGYTVNCMGVQIVTSTVDVMSPDLNCAPTVEALDFAILASDWLKNGAGMRTDYNNDGFVEALDFAIFASHWLHNAL